MKWPRRAELLADALADEFAVFAWRLRAEAFLWFDYDPEGAFRDAQDEYGFVERGQLKEMGHSAWQVNHAHKARSVA